VFCATLNRKGVALGPNTWQSGIHFFLHVQAMPDFEKCRHGPYDSTRQDGNHLGLNSYPSMARSFMKTANKPTNAEKGLQFFLKHAELTYVDNYR
jgi:hypothetical protein